MSKFTLDRDTHQELVELIEDSLQYFCDEQMISGELSWVVLECLAKAKQAEMRGELV